MKTSWLKRIIRMLLLVLASMLLVILVSSFFAKYVVERKGGKLIGRPLTVSWTYVNPFTGYAYISNLKVYESSGNRIFFAANSISTNITMLKIPRHVFEVSEITITKPLIYLVQDSSKLNINDIIKRFSRGSKNKKDNNLFQINLLNIKIGDGEFHYSENTIPIDYFIKNLRFESRGKWSKYDTLDFKLSFSSGTSEGKIAANGMVNLKTLDYRMNRLQITSFNLDIIGQYMKELTNYGHFSAVFDADLKGTGNFKDRGKTVSSGFISLSDLHVGKAVGEDDLSIKRFLLRIHKIHPDGYVYHYDSAVLKDPFIRYEKYDYLDNFQRMFGRSASNIKAVNAQRQTKFNLVIEVAHFIQEIARNLTKSNYQIGRLAIYNGRLCFDDFSKSEKFSITAHPFNLTVDSIYRKQNHLNGRMQSQLLPYGLLQVSLQMNPKDTAEIDLNYHLNHLPLAMFNPYVITFTSFPLNGGTLQLNGRWTVKHNKINSSNHLQLIHPSLAEHIKRKDAKKIPLPIILAFLKERDNNIDYNIPVTGSLQHPLPDLTDALLKLITNIISKPVTIPYTTQVKQVTERVEKFQEVQWPVRLASLNDNQEKFLKKINKFMEKSPNARLSVLPITYEEKEKEYILYFEAKKRYYLAEHKMRWASFESKDSIAVERMSVKDNHFIGSMLKYLNDTVFLFTTRQKCAAYLGKIASPDSQNLIKQGEALVNMRYSLLRKQRENKFLSFFNKDEVKQRIIFLNGQTEVPFNGFSFYKLTYKNDIPDDLRKAYLQMLDL